MRSAVAPALLSDLKAIVGSRHCLSAARATLRYRQGFRGSQGEATAVVRPGGLLELWNTLQACVRADAVVVMQAANTGLTGGSTPSGAYDRPVVVINTCRLDRLHLMDGGRQAVCLPGVRLHALERALDPFDREPHSVLGSSCFGATVVGGVCNNSGGALVRRGPAYTELSVYARLTADGRLDLVNDLGVALGSTPEEMLRALESGAFDRRIREGDGARAASDRDYDGHVRAIDAVTPARFNADARRLNGASGCAGKIAVFAVRTDTFPRPKGETLFYLGTNDPGELAEARRHILSSFEPLPISAEYMHRDAFDIAERYGRDMVLAVRLLGTQRLPTLFAAKARVDRWGEALGLRHLSDRLLQAIGERLPSHLPRRLKTWRARYAHHLMLKVDQNGLVTARAWVEQTFPSASGDAFECTASEAKAALLHRFVTAGAAARYSAIHADAVEALVALDVALPRNARRWVGPHGGDAVLHALHYGHFLCHVFHHDYLLARGSDASAFKSKLLLEFTARGAEYPAEHNVGHLYKAKSPLEAFYRRLDPLNRFNPGLGGASRARAWDAGKTSDRKSQTA